MKERKKIVRKNTLYRMMQIIKENEENIAKGVRVEDSEAEITKLLTSLSSSDLFQLIATLEKYNIK